MRPGAKVVAVLCRFTVAAALLMAGLPGALAGQSGGERDRGAPPGILGVVVDRETRRPLENVAVTLRPLGDGAEAPGPVLTAANGRFAFGAVADGRYRIAMSRIGYQTLADSLVYETALGLRIDAELVQEAVELDPLLVVAEARSRNLESRGFYQRMRRGMGRFVTRAEIQGRNALQVSDVLRTIAGVHMTSGGSFRTDGVVLLRGGCVADVYVDGVRTIPPFPVDAMLQPDDLDGVELYRGAEMPAEFGTTSCGAVMLWTHVPNPGTRGAPFSWRRVLAVLGFVAGAFLLTR